MGIGKMAIGLSSGLGVTLPSTSPARARPATGYTVGGCVSSAKIDGLERDFVVDDYGNEEPMDDVEQRVFLCLRTSRDSRKNWPQFGLSLPDKIQPATVVTDITERVRQALAPVISDGSITLQTVEVTIVGTNGIYAQIWYRNNRSKTAANIALTLRR
jgi:hypothetical protein